MSDHKTVLLVDDDEHDQYFFIEALKAIDNATLLAVAKNGRDALMKMENPDVLPDMIFSDIRMPLMNGIECLAAIKAKTEIAHIPVVMLSSEIDQVDTVRRLGACGFIRKTSDLEELKDKIQMAVNTDFSHEKSANAVFLMF